MPANPRFLNPKTLSPPPGYTHVVETTGPGRIIYVSGQLGTDLDGKIVGAPGDFRTQATKAFENLKHALAAVGASVKDVVKITNYLVGMEHIDAYRDVRDAHLNMSAPPASTAVGVTKLAREGALFEIEAIAVLPAKARSAASRTQAKAASRRGGRAAKSQGRLPPRRSVKS